MAPPDQHLIDEFRATGQRQLLDELLHRHLTSVRTIVFQMVLDHSTADDLTQDVLLKVVRGIERFEGRSEFSTWLYRIAMNTVHSHFKQLGRTQVIFQNELPANAVSSAPGPDSAVLQVELTTEIQTALAQLSPQLRAAIVLISLQGRSTAEAAEIEDCSTDTMYWRTHEARRQLKKLLAEHLR